MLKAHCNSKGLCYKTDVDINLHIPPDRGIGVGWGGGGGEGEWGKLLPPFWVIRFGESLDIVEAHGECFLGFR